MNKEALKSMVTHLINDKTDAATDDFKRYMQTKSQQVLKINEPQHETKSNAEDDSTK